MDFNKLQLDYSLKNIPIPTEDNFLRKFIYQLEKFITNIRWRALFFEQDNDNNENQKQTFGFKSERTPPPKTVP